MRQLKYIKLFEAIESINVTKTMAFLNPASKTKFLDALKNIASKIDFPVSEYSDEFFQYLPFDEALELNMTADDEPCEGTSEAEFGSYGIAGETCQGGRIKRKWGQSVRTVACTVCSGTGVKPKKYNEIKWIKFWFDKDGNWVNVTATDGNIRRQISPKKQTTSKYSNNIEDYTESESITDPKKLFDLNRGDYIQTTISRNKVIARIWKTEGDVYAIQDVVSGGAPYGESWKTYGSKSWNISCGDFFGSIKVLVPKPESKKDDDVEVDPYSWNAPLNMRYMGLGTDSNVVRVLSAANFAIVLDFLELKKSKYKTKSTTVAQRQEQKIGASALLDTEEIKKININRYLDEISKKIKINKDFSNMQDLIFRFFGFSKIGWYILSNRRLSDFNRFITRLYKFLSEGGENEWYYNQCLDHLKEKTKSNINLNMAIEDNFVYFNTPEKKQILKQIQSLNEIIYNKFKSYKVENIDDLEIVYQKMRTIYSIFNDSERFNTFSNLKEVIDEISDEYRLKKYLQRTVEEDQDLLTRDIERFKKIIDKV